MSPNELPDLSHLDDVYNEAEAPSGNTINDGTYQMRIESVSTDTNEHQASIRLHLVVLAGPSRGRKAVHFLNIRFDGARIEWIKKDLLTLGYRGPISKVMQHLEDFTGKCLEVNFKTTVTAKGTFQNSRLNKAIDPAMIPEDSAGPDADFSPPPPEDDIPF